jgi:hypothetical protein
MSGDEAYRDQKEGRRRRFEDRYFDERLNHIGEIVQVEGLLASHEVDANDRAASPARCRIAEDKEPSSGSIARSMGSFR